MSREISNTLCPYGKVFLLTYIGNPTKNFTGQASKIQSKDQTSHKPKAMH